MTKSNTHTRPLPICAALSCAVLFAAPGCDAGEVSDGSVQVFDLEINTDPDKLGDLDHDIYEIDQTPDDEDELGPDQDLQARPPLARFARGTSVVEWRTFAGSDEVFLVISGTTTDAPLIDMDTAESLSPIEAWVAIADEPTAVPEPLLARATAVELELLARPDQIDSLRAGVHETIGAANQIQGQLPENDVYGTCTSGQISLARSVFGQGYTSASTCGDNPGFVTTNKDYLYCASGPGGSCAYGLGTSGCSPAVGSGAYIKGKLAGLSMRSRTSGNPNMTTGGHRIRGFAYNCHGNGSLTAHLEQGPYSTSWSVPHASYLGVATLATNSPLPDLASARWTVQYGAWKDGVSASGSGYQTSKFSITGNAAAGDYGIFCADVQKSLTMVEGPTGNSEGWCSKNNDCDGNCWSN